jgi:hypothetical protein
MVPLILLHSGNKAPTQSLLGQIAIAVGPLDKPRPRKYSRYPHGRYVFAAAGTKRCRQRPAAGQLSLPRLVMVPLILLHSGNKAPTQSLLGQIAIAVGPLDKIVDYFLI